ncbi:MAG: hypothetical protein LBH95_02275 [Oscillospiraceae bacterium]|jgi:hypothetical protein|nr:hypothetical protein [Oscillospiraceae bacterium]
MQQTQKTGLSKNEKRLLVIVTVVALFYVAFQFGFMPQYNLYLERTDEYGKLLDQEMMVNRDLAGESAIRANYKQTLEDYALIEKQYRPASKSEEIGRELTKLCLDNGLEGPSLTLSKPVDFYAPGGDGAAGGEAAAFCTVTATVAATTSYDSLKSLLNAVDRIGYVRVSSLSFGFGEEGFGGEDPEAELQRTTVTFEVTMLNSL